MTPLLRKLRRLLLTGCAGFACFPLSACRQNPEPLNPALRVEWPVYGGDPGAQRYSGITGITTGNVAGLRQAWSWRTGERRLKSPRTGEMLHPDKFEATPVMLGDTLYLSTPYNRAVALDANSGRQLWQFDPGATEWGSIGDDRAGFVHRGVAVWTGAGGRRVFLNSRWRLLALDAATGKPIAGFGSGGEADLTRDLRWPVDRYVYGNTSPPVVFGNLVVVGSSVTDRLIHDKDAPGDVQAFDVITGRRVWSWEPVPRAGVPGSESWEDGANERIGHANVWAPFSVDTARGLLYLPVSAPSNDWFGGRRKGAGLYGESLVCLDARSGRPVWHFQLQHHGLWDYDPPAAPVLMSLTVEGRGVDAVALLGKTGFVYVFDRVTGKPLWPIEERPVPASDVPGEAAWPSQPFPTRPPAFSRQGLSDSDLVDFTPELHARARALFDSLYHGPLFSPPSLRGTIVMPGWLGGAGWGGGAFDPATATLYVKATNLPVLGRLIPRDSAGFVLDPAVRPDLPLLLDVPAPTGPPARVPLVKPPYGTLVAIDLAKGELRWQVTLGDSPGIRFHPALQHLKLPPLGVAGSPGPLVTRGGLVFITGGGSVLYAIEAASGRTLWSFDLGQMGYSNPMAYRTAAGREFVVVATGVAEGAKLVAFALPRVKH
jgi:quinoprotein glucose dehydrogenase